MKKLQRILMSEYAVLDSFAWFEYFQGSVMGEKVKAYVEEGKAITPTIVIAELSEKYSRLRLDFSQKFQFIKFNSRIFQLNDELAAHAGRISSERKKVKRWSLVDSIILATARD